MAGKSPVEVVVETVHGPRVLNALDALAKLPPNWNGYGAEPIDRRTLAAVRDSLLAAPPDIAPAPQIVPMTRGRVQLEWHRADRSLELEFETPDVVRYLKWDPAEGVEEEASLSASDRKSLFALMRSV